MKINIKLLGFCLIFYLFAVAHSAHGQSGVGGGIYQTTAKARPVTFAQLGGPVNGFLLYCTNCFPTSPCTSGGSGALAVREAGSWNCGHGTGDASGPASSTDNAVARFDGTGGKTLQNSVLLVGDTGNITGAGTLNTHTIPGGTGTFALHNIDNSFTAGQSITGNVGIGVTKSATTGEHLVIQNDGDNVTLLKVKNAGTGTTAVPVVRVENDNGSLMSFQQHGSFRTVSRFGITSLGGWSELLSIPQTSDDGLVIGTSIEREVRIGTNSAAAVIYDGTNQHAAYPTSDKCTTAAFDVTTNTTLATVTGLTVNVTASRKYRFRAILHVTPDATGGHKYAIAGTATATSVVYQINSINNATNAFRINSRQTALGGSAGDATGTGAFTTIEGFITVNAAGTLLVQFAQNASNGTSSILAGSCWSVVEVK